MAIIRLIDKEENLVIEESVKHESNSLKPLPRVINHKEKTYRFVGYFDRTVAVYKESNF